MKHTFEIWTDGSCKGNGQENAIGGYAFLIYCDAHEIARGSKMVKNTTNNRMEMTAILVAMRQVENFIYNNLLPSDEISIIVYTDSAYCQNCYTQKWYKNWQLNNWVNSKKQPVKNKDLWEELIDYFELPQFHLAKVKGHADNENNNIVDAMAQQAADGKQI